MAQLAYHMSDSREALYEQLMAKAAGDDNHAALASMLASWHYGETAMPDWLGLSRVVFREMMAWHFPTARYPDPFRGRVVDSRRREEMQDLRQLLLANRAGRSQAEEWVAELLVVGCMAPDHLWQDLGLWSRSQLSALMEQNFPRLAARNQQNMKWKRFLYKQLCETEGVYTCRVPSCEQCSDYAACFGAEG